MYIADMLQRNLYGKYYNSVSGEIANWSPNDVRSLIITKYFIAIFYHLPKKVANPTICVLAPNKVEEDILESRKYSVPKLNTVLFKRSFSCLEEIYIDKSFDGTLIDMEAFILGMNKDINRLRRYGYIVSLPNYQQMLTGYMNYLAKGYKQSNYDLSLYDYLKEINLGILDSKETGNKNWHTSYYLRPKYYKLDGENGALSRHFRKVESVIETNLQLKSKSSAKAEEVSLLRTLVEQDKNNSVIVNLILTINKNKDESDAIFELSKLLNPKLYYDENKLYLIPSESINYILKENKDISSIYKMFNCFSIKENKLGDTGETQYLEKLKKRVIFEEGLGNFCDMLDYLLVEAFKKLSKNPKFKSRASIAILTLAYDKEIGSTRARKDCTSSDKMSNFKIEPYVKVISSFIGFKLDIKK